MEDDGAGDVGAEDGGVVGVVEADGADTIAAYDERTVDQARVGWVVSVGANAAGKDGSAGEIREDVGGYVDVAGGEADAAEGGIRVVADAESVLAEVREDAVAKGDAEGRGDLDGGRHLRPATANALEGGTALRARRDGIGWVGGRIAGEERAALLTGVSLRAGGTKPGGVGEADTAEGEIVDGIGEGSADRHENTDTGKFNVEVVDVGADGRPEIELAVHGVQKPLTGLRKQRQSVGEVETRELWMVRLLDGVVAPEIVVPGWLSHDESATGDALHGSDAFGEETGGAELEAGVLTAGCVKTLGESGRREGLGVRPVRVKVTVGAVEFKLEAMGARWPATHSWRESRFLGVSATQMWRFGVGEGPVGDGDGTGEDGVGVGGGPSR